MKVERLEINNPTIEFTRAGYPVSYEGVFAGYETEEFHFSIEELDQYDCIDELLVTATIGKPMFFKKCCKVMGDKKGIGKFSFEGFKVLDGSMDETFSLMV